MAPFSRRHGKGTAYEGGVNVPLIVSGPAVQSPGREVSALVHAVDLYPTIAELAGVEPSAGFVKVDGISVLPYMHNALQSPLRSATYSELFDRNPNTEGFACARDAQYKIIRRFTTSGASDELYDLVADPFESNDLLTQGPLSTAQQAAATALTGVIEGTRNTTGSLVPYGTASCLGSNGIPQISGTGIPRIGMGYSVQLAAAPPATVAMLHFGESSTSWLGLPLPFPLSQLGGGTGCRLYASGEAFVTVWTDAAGGASMPIPIPAETVLIGGAVRHAWSIFDPGAPANPLQITATQGLTARLGS